MGYYRQETAISYNDIANKIADDEISDLSGFLRTLEAKLRKRAEPEEDTALLPEDLYILAIADGIAESLKNAAVSFKNSNRQFFSAPSHEQIQEQIKELMKQRAERLAKEQAATEREELRQADFDSLLPKVEEEAREFYKLCVEHPISRMYFDGETLTIRFKDGTAKDQPMTEDTYKRTLNYWHRWNTTQSWKETKTLGRDEQGIDNGKGHPVGSHAQ